MARAAGCVQGLTTQDFFLFVLFPNIMTSCRFLASRGQPCIMSALTAKQLFWIQSLDTQSDLTKLWMTSSCRSSCSYSSNLLFKGANFNAWSCGPSLVPHKSENRQGGLSSAWFGSFILNPGALLSMSVCWFIAVVWNFFCISEEITPKTPKMQHCCCSNVNQSM